MIRSVCVHAVLPREGSNWDNSASSHSIHLQRDFWLDTFGDHNRLDIVRSVSIRFLIATTSLLKEDTWTWLRTEIAKASACSHRISFHDGEEFCAMIKWALEGFLKTIKAHDQCEIIGIVFLVGHRDDLVLSWILFSDVCSFIMSVINHLSPPITRSPELALP